MIVLDTNVVSELMRPAPAPAVIEWVDAQPPRLLHLTAVTAAELLYGLARLPDGRRRDQVGEAVQALLEEQFASRVLAFDLVAAAHYADIVAGRETRGRPVSTADGQIAATCRSHGALLATRNVADFTDTGVEVVDPWVG